MFKLLLKQGYNEFFVKDGYKDIVWDRKKDCEAFKCAIEGCQRLVGYDVIIKEC